ncbi:MAG: hypothetical protein UZ12_BCD005000404 [Bacteroidetes bacterium OLB12]|nr:MAG: hypothetical protein UZ12_BCD005000404 [Bacteroidetes bacterium OLB12]
MLLFYEQNNISAFKEIFINQFEFAVNPIFKRCKIYSPQLNRIYRILHFNPYSKHYFTYLCANEKNCFAAYPVCTTPLVAAHGRHGPKSGEFILCRK